MSLNIINQKREQLKQLQARLANEGKKDHESIAIVGMHGFLPSANSLDEFWSYLDNDESVIEEIPCSRFNINTYYDPSGTDAKKTRSKWGGYIPDIQSFDPGFFGFLPDEADLLDPQQRLLLISVFRALEDTGITLEDISGSKTGVYVAIENNDYLNYLRKENIDLGLNGFNHHPSMAANRLSYFFNLHGPSEIINTMCSSAAVAINNAMQALRRKEIDTCIVAGAHILLDPDVFIGLSRLKILSTSNTVKSYSSDADGYLRSEGVAAIVLKRLSSAERAGDYIYANIKEAAINYNGHGGMSIAAPNLRSHIDVVKSCYQSAGIDVNDISYIEAQGMGNKTSDVVEWEALNRAIEELAAENHKPFVTGQCRISTLKPMLGHMECVSAFGALFKIIRSLQTNTIHRIIGANKATSSVDCESRPCQLVYQTESWLKENKGRLAAIHSYGSGGNNAHVLIEEYENNHYKPMRSYHAFKNITCWKYPNKQNTNKVKKVCIVGAGPSGIVMAKSLLEEKHQPFVYEKQSELGGLWVLKKDKSAGAYKKTRFQSSRFTSTFSDFYCEDLTNTFYTVNDVKSYLKRYASHFGVNQNIHYNSEIVSVIAEGTQWKVDILHAGKISTEIFDGVALCQGSFWQPYIPHKEGVEKYSGIILHSGAYYEADLFKDKRVLIIGNGVSAMDIVEEAVGVADSVVWSKRSNKLILPRMVGFVPNDCQSPASLLIKENTLNIIDRLKHSMPKYYETYKRSGLLPSDAEFRANPIVHINETIIELVADNKVLVKGDVVEFNGQGCRFESSSDGFTDFDIVVFCTGYKNFLTEDKRYSYLKNISVKDDFSMGIFYERNTSLVNTSVLPISFTGSFYYLEMIARWYSQLLSGHCRLTDAELKDRITDDRYSIMAPISNIIFCIRLGLIPKPETEFSEFWRLINCPAFPMISRLRGFHRSALAEEQLNDYLNKSYVKTDTASDELKQLKYRILAGLGLEVITKLLKTKQISEADFRNAQQHEDNSIVLTWDLQYIVKPSIVMTASAKGVNGLTEQMNQIITRLVRCEPSEVDHDRNLSSYGFDSITLTSFATEVASIYPFIRLEPATFLENPTLTSLINFLNNKYQREFNDLYIPEKQQNPLLDVLQTGKSQNEPVIWFHGALGTVQQYLPLIKNMGNAIPFYGIQSAGIDGKSQPMDNMMAICDAYVHSILQQDFSGEIHLGGYSQGGVIAYEVAKRFRLANKGVASVVMIDAPFPPVTSYMSEAYYYVLTLLNILNINGKASLSDLQNFNLDVEPTNGYADYYAKIGIELGLNYTVRQLSLFLERYALVSKANIASMSQHISTQQDTRRYFPCYYFARKNTNEFFPVTLENIDDIRQQNNYYTQSNCCKRWQVMLPECRIIQTESRDHFSFFDEGMTLSLISRFCNALYTGSDMTAFMSTEFNSQEVL